MRTWSIWEIEPGLELELRCDRDILFSRRFESATNLINFRHEAQFIVDACNAKEQDSPEEARLLTLRD